MPGSLSGEQRALLRAYREHGDVAARDRLIELYLPLVQSLARRYAGRGEPLDDLVQVGSIGLLKAIDRFDLAREVEFSTYAAPTILGEIKHHFRDRVWLVTVPRRLKDLSFTLSRLVQELTGELGRSPTISELAWAAGVAEEDVLEAMEVAHGYAPSPLPGRDDHGDGAEGDPIDQVPDPNETYSAADDRAVIAAGFQALELRERRILQLRFFDGLTQSQIAAEVGISQMHVSRLIRKALEQLQDEIKEI